MKVDLEGKLYDLVTILDLVEILKKEGFRFNEKNILLSYSIKEVGNHEIKLKLTEGFIDNITVSLKTKPIRNRRNTILFSKPTIKF